MREQTWRCATVLAVVLVAGLGSAGWADEPQAGTVPGSAGELPGDYYWRVARVEPLANGRQTAVVLQANLPEGASYAVAAPRMFYLVEVPGVEGPWVPASAVIVNGVFPIEAADIAVSRDPELTVIFGIPELKPSHQLWMLRSLALDVAAPDEPQAGTVPGTTGVMPGDYLWRVARVEPTGDGRQTALVLHTDLPEGAFYAVAAPRMFYLVEVPGVEGPWVPASAVIVNGGFRCEGTTIALGSDAEFTVIFDIPKLKPNHQLWLLRSLALKVAAPDEQAPPEQAPEAGE